MADLERYAVRRDRRFLVRLVALIVAGAVVGLVLYGQLTSDSSVACLARTFENTPAPVPGPYPAPR
jgi:hypothetical protein